MSTFQLPRTAIYDSDGAPYSGAKAYFYAAGTSTPQNTYSDRTLLVANTNPVVADASGRFGPIYLNPLLRYKLILTTSADVTLYTQDELVVGGYDQMRMIQEVVESTGVTFDADNYDQLYDALVEILSVNQLVTARDSDTPRSLSNRFAQVANVLDFGAVGDGANDDTTAIQNAIDSGVHEIVFPAYLDDGTEAVYLHTGLTIDADSSSTSAPTMRLRGEGGRPTVKLTSGSNRIALAVSKRRFVYVEDIRFLSSGTKADGNNTEGIQLVDNNSRVNIRRCHFENFSKAAVRCVQSLYVGLEDIDVLNCAWGISIEKDAGSTVSTTTDIDRAYISNCTRGLHSDYCVGGRWDGLVFEGCGSSSTTDGALHLLAGTRGITIGNVYFEANARNMVLTDARVVFVGQVLIGSATASDSITWSGVSAADRGQAKLVNDRLSVAEIYPDTDSGRALDIGGYVSFPNNGDPPSISDATSIQSDVFKTGASDVPASGVIRIGNRNTTSTEFIGFRNAANNATLALDVHSTDRLRFDTVNVVTASSTDSLSNKSLVGYKGSYFGWTTSLVDVLMDLNTTHEVVGVDTTVANGEIRLPTAVGIAGRQYTIKLITAGGNQLTLNNADGTSETIDGAADYVLNASGEFVTVVSNGVNWLIIGQNP